MSVWVPVLLSALTGYLAGSVNGAVLASRILRRTDVRMEGSGNAGATNAFRVHGTAAAVLTLVFDAAKTVLAVLLARILFSVTDTVLSFDPGYIAGLFVILGHMYPVFFGFRGGEGRAGAARGHPDGRPPDVRHPGGDVPPGAAGPSGLSLWYR